jgi:uncharacterized protein YerC
VYDENERLQHALLKRKNLERELRDAEILLGLARQHLLAADEHIRRLVEDPAPREKVTRVTPEMELEVCEEWKAGERSFLRIAMAAGLATATVRRILIARKYYYPRKPMTDLMRQEIIRRFDAGEGESVRTIAKDVGYSVTTVSKVLRVAGFETNPLNRREA